MQTLKRLLGFFEHLILAHKKNTKKTINGLLPNCKLSSSGDVGDVDIY
jgi:hypothetical protein